MTSSDPDLLPIFGEGAGEAKNSSAIGCCGWSVVIISFGSDRCDI